VLRISLRKAESTDRCRWQGSAWRNRGIHRHEQVAELIASGASEVQLGTPFAVTEEGDAHPNFKKILADALPEQVVTFMSTAGLPARAVNTPWLANYLAKETKLLGMARAKLCTVGFDCLQQCGCATASPVPASSASTPSSPSRSRATSSAACCSAAPSACGSATRSARCAN
jgi:NAD(P)H-dependent flavin oxidoreductase YrpB (nitropropane dioxygenase family)